MISKVFIKITAVIQFLMLVLPASATVSIPRLFSDGAVLQRDKPVLVWGGADAGEEVTVSMTSPEASINPAQLKKAMADESGFWSLWLDPLRVGAPLAMRVSGKSNAIDLSDILVGDVFQVSGQSNAAMSMGSCARLPDVNADMLEVKLPQVRIFEVPWALFKDTPQTDVPESCKWKSLNPQTNPGFAALAFYFARSLHQHLGVPIGIVRASHAGGRAEIKMSKEALLSFEGGRKSYDASIKAYETAKAKKEAEKPQVNTHDGLPPEPVVTGTVNGGYPSSDWNAAIAPVIRFTKRGIVWYQGEHNAGDGAKYTETLAVLLQSWREASGDTNMPILLVQLPRYEAKGWPMLRESQLAAYRHTPNTGFVVTIDLGEKDNIHPADKKPVGERLAFEARRLIYNEDVSGCGPLYRDMTIEGNQAVLRFTNIGTGLKAAEGTSLEGFQIADSNRNFLPAQAQIVGDTILVQSPEMTRPEAVRYLWESFPPMVSLFNKEGLPASPFRTDTWNDKP
jgi:sialate O-acetylesterase